MCANSRSNWFNTIAVRASHILLFLKKSENQEKPVVGQSPPGKNQNKHHFVFFSSGVDPLN